MAKSQQSRNMSPGRALALMALVVAVLFGAIGIGVATSDDRGWTPKLGLDLEGGSTLTLTPLPGQGSKVTTDNINEAVSIISQRINASGVGESEVTSQGTGSGRSIVVSVPGKQNNKLLEDAARTAQLRIRQVLVQTSAAATPATSTEPSAAATPVPSSSETAGSSASPSPSTSTQGRTVSQGLLSAAAAATPASSAAATPASSAAATPAATPGATPAPSPGATVTADEVQKELSAYAKQLATQYAAGTDVTAQLQAAPCPPGNRIDPTYDSENDPVIACDGAQKYLLAKADLVGRDISDAFGEPETNSQGQSLSSWQVSLNFTGSGSKKWSALTKRVAALTGTAKPNLISIELDGGIISTATVEQQLSDNSRITGSFSASEAKTLGRQIKFGALPISFAPGNVQTISPTLGNDQLTGGLLAGGIGLALVVLYSLLYYRGLGLVSVASLACSALVTYGIITFLSNQQGLALSLSSIAGLIVAIGITADSFIVYFERLRDEVREGRTLRVAVETGWTRARRTILTADFVSFLAAAVLYVLSVGSVRGFAYTLGLTTIVDVIIVFLFTKPLVTLAARSSFFTGGHPWSGLDPRRLGAKPRPAAPVRTRPRATDPSTVRGQEA
ncbi:preprotein translocase subunit SecD [Motilibacter peucedani]|uniref:Protein translocase subunit SecD n=1 Tax=Motilibacter peucedani TaxID=598650 RepID=A0A420XSD9_9ACTN|nr:protein translocase subunit SecD [Motilibacter peucedani]RKS77731.1 preprotein translocase subunit SecD [Motilibacter peucedani]